MMSGHNEGKTGNLLKKNHRVKIREMSVRGGVINEPSFATGAHFNSRQRHRNTRSNEKEGNQYVD